ncbi:MULTISPECIES: hypothetical protein [Prochlorococcus]|uniref:Uncharacterized membrane protein n=1 Tax=Prochlorococcus marinus (strain SARG / CCMP1375 / SS120) TaxID=167539 RepID=Q7VD71_PROMA|nr:MULTISPECIES: hypothetical protein [Prochlorococcus]AAP99557.1 Uncharacterized membrane protein [Prochlorococcus marinus subsp. marinus str. CCMP1375]KGG11169.1 hypothetical protein EV04_1244 [Prochlorococcus marinus str. LG]KGG21507.1 hypothetical protein EV08_0594 [Prochlorococcus marinus str. SS2]KGG23148.1 hypothetical protein EV09_1894 [Prochlorococcus marinus str. SS35]KGG33859.1 hypothetical protein EV10_0296 [Prochlorococcus marinus str. SS51]
MALPRWQKKREKPESKLWVRWEKLIAFVAMINLGWIIFDLSYIPLRSFWINRSIDIPNSSTSISLRWIPNITPSYDKIRGIKSSKSSKEVQSIFNKLNQEISNNGVNSIQANRLLAEYKTTLNATFNELTLISQKDLDRVETIKIMLRLRSGESDYKSAYNKLLNKAYIAESGWENEKKFWERKLIPKLNSDHIKIINKDGNNISHSWKIDIPFQIIFLLDILLKVRMVRYRLNGIKLRHAFLKRLIDIPLLLPFSRLLRILPVLERVCSSKLIPTEPIRAKASQWIVSLLAIEIFEILTIRAIDSVQNIVKSPMLPDRIRSLCSYQSIKNNEKNEISEFLRIWIPLLLKKVGPNMRPQLIDLFEHALQKSLKANPMPDVLKNNLVLEKAESALSSQLASGMIDAILDLSKNAGSQLAKKDILLEELTVKTIDRFWEELAIALENDSTLKSTQILLLSILEGLKLSSLNELKSQSSAAEIIEELDILNLDSEKSLPK